MRLNLLVRRRVRTLILISTGVGCAAALALYALRENINLYYTPSDIQLKNVPYHRTLRVGGMVVPHSLHREADRLTVHFAITDYQYQIQVSYKGILPDLFREEQGVVVQGELIAPNQLVAKEVLAKHDEKYHPPAGIPPHVKVPT